MKKTAVLDIECYVNYFLVMLKDVESGSVVAFEKHEDSDEPDFAKLASWRTCQVPSYVSVTSSPHAPFAAVPCE